MSAAAGRLVGELFGELRQYASARANFPAVLAPGRPPLTFHRLLSQAEYLAGFAPRGLTTLLLPNGPELLTAGVGTMLNGAAAPLNPDLTDAEFERQLTALQPDNAIIGPGARASLEALLHSLGIRVWRAVWDAKKPAGVFEVQEVPPAAAARAEARQRRPLPADTRLLLLTSGTTGSAKIAPITAANLVATLANGRRAFAMTAADRYLPLTPLFHLFGLGSALAQLTAGGSVMCAEGFEPNQIPLWLREFRPTWYACSPAMHRAVVSLAESGTNLAVESLRFVRCSGAALDPALRESIERVLGVPVIDSYANTESSLITANPLPPLRRKPGSAGVSAGPEIAILGPDRRTLPAEVDGEIAVRGPNVIDGYLGDAAANAEAFIDGWFLTGDLGKLDEEGYLFVTGRRKDVINRGGSKLMPAEIEAALLAHPDVAEAAVFGAAHATLGEDVEAAVVLRAGARLTETDLRAHAATRLAAFKTPRRIHFASSIPRTAIGKPIRSELRALYEGAPAPGERLTRAFTARESRIASIWSRALKRDEIGLDDDLFTLGGDSLSAAIILAEVQAEFAVVHPLFRFFDKPTVEHLARLVSDGPGDPARAPAVHLAGQGPRTPVFCIPAVASDPYYLRHLAVRVDRERPFYVLSRSFDPESASPATIEEIASEAVQDIRAAQPAGPYILAGHCFGGVVAFEAARRLRAEGEPVRLLLMFDSPTPGYPKILPRWRRYPPAAWNLLRSAGPAELLRECSRHVRMLTRHRRRTSSSPAPGISPASPTLHRYCPAPLDVPIVQVMCANHQVSAMVLEDARLGWRDFARAGFRVVEAPGDHDSFLLPPHVDHAARGVQDALESAAV